MDCIQDSRIGAGDEVILVVHLYGQASNMGAIVELCKKYNLRLVEDCAQSYGAKFAG